MSPWVFLTQHGSPFTTTNTFSMISKYDNNSISANFYLQWAVPGYTAEISKINGEVDKDKEEDEEDDEVNGAVAEDEGMEGYTIAKKPALCNVSVTSIVSDYGATDFLQHLSLFIDMEPLVGNITPSTASTFDLYKQVRFVLPPIPEVMLKPTPDIIHAVRAAPAVITSQGIKRAVPGRFSTVLIQESLSIAAGGPLSGKPQTPKCHSFISLTVLSLGLCVAQVWVIFKLPAEFGQYNHPLAYAHWYTPLQHTPNDLDTNMFAISRSSHNHHQHASIIPVAKILWSCHLVPKFGCKIPNTWTSSTVLDDATNFFLNPYLHHHEFFLLQYLVDLHVS